MKEEVGAYIKWVQIDIAFLLHRILLHNPTDVQDSRSTSRPAEIHTIKAYYHFFPKTLHCVCGGF